MSQSPKKPFSYQHRSNVVAAFIGHQPSESEQLRQRVSDLEQERSYLESELKTSQQLNIFPKSSLGLSLGLGTTQEAVVRENAVLQTENEKLNRLAKQKKTDADLWKSRYDAQQTQILQVKSNYEQEIRTLQGEIDKMKIKLNEFEFERNRQVMDSKVQIESRSMEELIVIKNVSSQQASVSEAQLRELRQHTENQSNQLDDLQAKLLRLKSEDDSEITRLQRDNENLRHSLQLVEDDKQRELEELSEQMSGFSSQQLDNVKQEMSNQNSMNEQEAQKLKGLLMIKNSEIETLLLQSSKSKSAFDEEMQQLRDENALMKRKMIDQERQHRIELEQFQERWAQKTSQELQDQSLHYQNNIYNLEGEINDLRAMVNHSQQEIQVHAEEKSNVRALLETQVEDLRRELANQQVHTRELENEKNKEIMEQSDQYQIGQSQMTEHITQQRSQIMFLEGEVAKLKELQNQKNKDQDSQYQQLSLQRRTLDDEIRRCRQEIDKLRTEGLAREQAKNNEIDELKSRLSRQESQYREKLRQSEIQLEQTELELKRCLEQLDIKKQEFNNLQSQKQSIEGSLKRCRDEIENLKNKIIQMERERNQSLEDLKQKLEQSNQFQVDQLKQAFNTQICILGEENQQLRQTLENRKQDIQELLEKYEQLQNALKDGKILNPDVAASRSIYDVYLKSKRLTKERD